MRIGFVGLGLMGLPMVLRLLGAGHTVMVHSTNSQALREARLAGGDIAQSVGVLATTSEILCSCRVTPNQSRAVFGDVPGFGRPICVDFATIDPMTSRVIAGDLRAHGIAYLDAPVSGGPDGAAAGTLTVMVGGDADAFERARPVLETIGRHLFHMGESGTGSTAKLCNNMITGTLHVLIAEAMVLGVKSGIAPGRLYEVLRSASARGNTLERVVPRHFLPNDFTPGSALTTMIKDMDCILRTGAALGVRLMLPAIAQQCFQEAEAQGHGAKDLSAVILPMQAIAGLSTHHTVNKTAAVSRDEKLA